MSNAMAPDIKTQRTMLEERINQYKQTGFSAFMEMEACKAQNPGKNPQAKAQHAEQVSAYEAQMNNAYDAARRLQAILDALPADESKEEPVSA